MTIVGAIVTLIPTIFFLRQPMRNLPTTFKVPLVPFVPILGMAANIFLMVQLNIEAWVRLAIWLAIGFGIYFFYGRNHSKLSPNYKGDPDEAEEVVIPDATH